MLAGETPDLSWIDHAALKRARCAPPHITLRARGMLGAALWCGSHVVETNSAEDRHALAELAAIGCDVTTGPDRRVVVRPSPAAAAIFDAKRPDRPLTDLEVALYEVLISVYCRSNRIGAEHTPMEVRGVHPLDVVRLLRPYGYDMMDRGVAVVLVGLRNERGEPMRVMRDRVVLRDRPPRPAKEYFWPY